MGMVLITRLGMKLGLCDKELLERLCRIRKQYHRPCEYNGNLAELAESCMHDKKRSGNTCLLYTSEYLLEAKKASGLPIVTEIMSSAYFLHQPE